MSFFKPDIDKERRKQEELKRRIKEQEAKLKVQREYKEQQEETKRMYNALRMKSLLDLSTLFTKIKLFFKGRDRMLIHMELTTGFHTQFVTTVKNNQFVYKGCSYIIDDEFKYYDLSAKMFALDYHQNINIPIQRKIPLNELKKIVESAGITDVETAINPLTLKQFIESEVIQKVMKGAELDKVFSFIKLMLILIAVASVVTLLIVVQSSGLLANLNLPWG